MLELIGMLLVMIATVGIAVVWQRRRLRAVATEERNRG
jgi:hypothetical protein